MKRDHEDLPLFRWTPPVAEVVPFPCARRVGKIRRTISQITIGTERSASAYWTRTINDLSNQMRRAGILEDRIAIELEAFASAVDRNLGGRSMLVRSAKGEGDAA